LPHGFGSKTTLRLVPRIVPNVDPAKVGADLLLELEDGIEELFPVLVLARPQRMGHTVQRVDDGAGKVIQRVHLRGNKRSEERRG
jgi:hypothetical protein